MPLTHAAAAEPSSGQKKLNRASVSPTCATRVKHTDHGFRFETSTHQYTTEAGDYAHLSPATIDKKLRAMMHKEYKEDENAETGATGIVAVTKIVNPDIYVYGYTHVHAEDSVIIADILGKQLDERVDSKKSQKKCSFLDVSVVRTSKPSRYFRRAVRLLDIIFGAYSTTYFCENCQIKHQQACDMPPEILQAGLDFVDDLLASDPWNTDPGGVDWKDDSPLRPKFRRGLESIVKSSPAQQTMFDMIARYGYHFSLPGYKSFSLAQEIECLSDKEKNQLERLRKKAPSLIGRSGPVETLLVKPEARVGVVKVEERDILCVYEIEWRKVEDHEYEELQYQVVRRGGSKRWRSFEFLMEEGYAEHIVDFLAARAHTRSVAKQKKHLELWRMVKAWTSL